MCVAVLQAELTKLSMLKATVDDTKGKTLNEISRIVADINVTLREKKASLAPQVQGAVVVVLAGAREQARATWGLQGGLVYAWVNGWLSAGGLW